MNRRIKLTITTSLVVVAIIIGGVVAYMPSQGYAQNATSNTNSSSNGNTTATNATSSSGGNTTK
jgi:hypothetical protein